MRNIFFSSHEVYSAICDRKILLSSLSRYTRLPLISRSCRLSVVFSEVSVVGGCIEVKRKKEEVKRGVDGGKTADSAERIQYVTLHLEMDRDEIR